MCSYLRHRAAIKPGRGPAVFTAFYAADHMFRCETMRGFALSRNAL